MADKVDPLKYGKTRNYVNGAATFLSLYTSRVVISDLQGQESVSAKRFKIPEMEPFVNELCCYYYFRRVGHVKDLIRQIK